MEQRLVLILSILLTFELALGDARLGFEKGIIFNQVREAEELQISEVNCVSCSEASRRAEEFLNINFPELFQEIELLSIEICHALPSHHLKIKCLEKTGSNIQKTKVFLKHLLHEASLCNDTNYLCRNNTGITGSEINSSTPADSILLTGETSDHHLQMIESSCSECRRGAKHVLEALGSSRLKKRIMGAIIDYCEEEEDNERQCKETVGKFAPKLISRLEDLKPNHLCRLIGFCTA